MEEIIKDFENIIKELYEQGYTEEQIKAELKDIITKVYKNFQEARIEELEEKYKNHKGWNIPLFFISF